MNQFLRTPTSRRVQVNGEENGKAGPGGINSGLSETVHPNVLGIGSEKMLAESAKTNKQEQTRHARAGDIKRVGQKKNWEGGNNGELLAPRRIAKVSFEIIRDPSIYFSF